MSGVNFETTSGAPGCLSLNTFSYAALGQTDKIRALIGEAEEAMGSEHVSAAALGMMDFAVGDKEKGFALFDRAIEERDAGVFMYSTIFTKLMGQARSLSELITTDPRFSSLLQRIGLA